MLELLRFIDAWHLWFLAGWISVPLGLGILAPVRLGGEWILQLALVSWTSFTWGNEE